MPFRSQLVGGTLVGRPLPASSLLDVVAQLDGSGWTVSFFLVADDEDWTVLMFRLIWIASVHVRYCLRRYMPSNIVLDLIRTRRGVEVRASGDAAGCPVGSAARIGDSGSQAASAT